MTHCTVARPLDGAGGLDYGPRSLAFPQEKQVEKERSP